MDFHKTTIERFLYPLMEFKKGNRTRVYIASMQESQHWPREALTALRREKLRTLLLTCVQDVPAYQQYKDYTGMIEDDPFDALSRFPILEKNKLRESAETYVNPKMPRESLIANCSGGSTSVPVQFYIDRPTVENFEAARWRGLSWYGITPGSRCVMLWGQALELNAGAQKREAIKEKWLKNRIMIPAYGMNLQSMPRYLQTIRRFKPEYIYGYASVLFSFADWMLQKNETIGFPLKCVVSTAETLHDYQREAVGKAFGYNGSNARVVNEYGAKDGGILAYECPCGQMHISAENVVLEVVDPVTREPLPIGEAGVLLVTDLNNRVMPRLRYCIGDRLALSDAVCECGVTLPVVEALDGREDDMFLSLDGKLIHGHAFNYISRRMNVVRKFQIVQHSPASATLRIVRDPNASDAALEDMVAEMRKLLPGSNFTVTYVSDIPATHSGKFRYAIRDFDLTEYK